MIDNYLADYGRLSDDELYELLGLHLLGEGPGALPDDHADEAAGYGRRWFRRRYHVLQEKICRSSAAQPFLGGSGSDRVMDAAAIYELLQHSGDEPVTAAVVAILVGRIGLSVFCADILTQ